MAITRIGNPAIADQRGVNFRNIIINGDMSIAQRSTSATASDASYNTCDRWRTTQQSLGVFTQSQSTTVPSGQGFATSLKMDCTTADASPAVSDRLLVEQRFEGQNLQYLKKGTSSAESLTCSFWVRSNKTGTYIVNLYDAINDRAISKSYTISSADTWEKKTITFAGDTTGAFNNDNANNLNIRFYLGAGTNFTSGTLQTSWGSNSNANTAVGQVNLADSTSNEWYITGVQLEAGQVASDFEFLPTDVNLRRCMRYYQEPNKGYRMDNYVANCYNTSSAYGQTTLSVPMRTQPSVTWNVVGTGDIQGFAGNSQKTLSSIGTSQLSPYAVSYNVVGTFTTGQAIHFNNYDTTNPFVKISAEL